jgi:hypothetical protein
MRKIGVLALFGPVFTLAACNSPTEDALGGAAIGAGIGLATGGSFGTVVGAGLIGGAVGYLGGKAIESDSLENNSLETN